MRKDQMTSAASEPMVEEDELIEDGLAESVTLRHDGYYWRASDGRQDFGPFDTIEQALADMGTTDEDTPEPGETLQEAEDEIGISDWIDPETGEPAEGQSHPRLEE